MSSKTMIFEDVLVNMYTEVRFLILLKREPAKNGNTVLKEID